MYQIDYNYNLLVLKRQIRHAAGLPVPNVSGLTRSHIWRVSALPCRMVIECTESPPGSRGSQLSDDTAAAPSLSISSGQTTLSDAAPRHAPPCQPPYPYHCRQRRPHQNQIYRLSLFTEPENNTNNCSRQSVGSSRHDRFSLCQNRCSRV